MAHKDSGQHEGPTGPNKSSLKKRKATVLPGYLHAHLQSRQMMTTMRLRPVDSTLSARAVPAALPGTQQQAGASAAVANTESGPKSAPACLKAGSRTYVPVRTLPLIFAQRKRHLQQQKGKAQHAEPYQRREGDGLLALPEDVLLKVVCSLTHDELRPLFQVCKALRNTLRNAVAYHFNYSTPSRPVEDIAPPALGERQRRPARTNLHAVISRLSRGTRANSGRGSGAASLRSAPRALDFADTAAAVASRA